MDTYDRNEMLQAMEQAKDAIAGLSGLRSQLIKAGWSQDNAEKMVIAMMQGGGGQK